MPNYTLCCWTRGQTRRSVAGCTIQEGNVTANICTTRWISSPGEDVNWEDNVSFTWLASFSHAFDSRPLSPCHICFIIEHIRHSITCLFRWLLSSTIHITSIILPLFTILLIPYLSHFIFLYPLFQFLLLVTSLSVIRVILHPCLVYFFALSFYAYLPHISFIPTYGFSLCH